MLTCVEYTCVEYFAHDTHTPLREVEYIAGKRDKSNTGGKERPWKYETWGNPICLLIKEMRAGEKCVFL